MYFLWNVSSNENACIVLDNDKYLYNEGRKQRWRKYSILKSIVFTVFKLLKNTFEQLIHGYHFINKLFSVSEQRTPAVGINKIGTFLRGYNVKCYVLCIQCYNTNVKWY